MENSAAPSSIAAEKTGLRVPPPRCFYKMQKTKELFVKTCQFIQNNENRRVRTEPVEDKACIALSAVLPNIHSSTGITALSRHFGDPG
jgi:hypothetical protein